VHLSHFHSFIHTVTFRHSTTFKSQVSLQKYLDLHEIGITTIPRKPSEKRREQDPDSSPKQVFRKERANLTKGRVGFGLKGTCVFSRIQFTKYFIEFIFVETNQLFGSNSNVILTRQTCGQRSGMAAGSKRQAFSFNFPYEFTKCS